jgi:hypothetical protein
MPSIEHAVLADLFRSRPALVPLLLRLVGVRVPEAANAAVVESTFPVAVPDFQVDLVIDLSERSPGRTVVLVEVQLAVDEDKPHRWLLYQAAAQDRHRCDAVVLVVTSDPHVAEWARRPRSAGPHGTYAPVVLGPAEIPTQCTGEQVVRAPELAVLVALAHGGRGEPNDARLVTAAEALRRIGADHAEMYADLLCVRLGEAMQRALEGVMGINGEPLSEYFRKHYRRGLAEGEAKGLAEALSGILHARGLIMTHEERRLIEACQDTGRLRRWVERAVTAGTVAEVLGHE